MCDWTLFVAISMLYAQPQSYTIVVIFEIRPWDKSCFIARSVIPTDDLWHRLIYSPNICQHTLIILLLL